MKDELKLEGIPLPDFTDIDLPDISDINLPDIDADFKELEELAAELKEINLDALPELKQLEADLDTLAITEEDFQGMNLPLTDDEMKNRSGKDQNGGSHNEGL